MSIKVMSAVWDLEGIDGTECLVLLALADHADDEGRCYPSIPRLSRRTKLSERGVRKVLSRLSEMGLVTVEIGAGRAGSNLYQIILTPERRSGGNHVQGGTTFPTPLNHVPKPPEPRSPKPSRTTIEPSRGGEEGARATADVDKPCHAPSLVAQLAEALGFNEPSGTGWPRYWVAADAPIIASRWVTDLGLTEAEVVEVAIANMRAHGSPANGPKTLTRHMQAFAAAKSAPPLEIPPQPTGGLNHDRPTARDRRQVAADDALRRRLHAAARVD